jgi:hypothetical protein
VFDCNLKNESINKMFHSQNIPLGVLKVKPISNLESTQKSKRKATGLREREKKNLEKN